MIMSLARPYSATVALGEDSPARTIAGTSAAAAASRKAFWTAPRFCACKSFMTLSVRDIITDSP
ncbi:hypothetical protein D3C87_1147890 [compost metagenome]